MCKSEGRVYQSIGDYKEFALSATNYACVIISQALSSTLANVISQILNLAGDIHIVHHLALSNKMSFYVQKYYLFSGVISGIGCKRDTNSLYEAWALS